MQRSPLLAALWTLLAATSVAAAPANHWTYDVSRQSPDPPTRDQGQIGDCHTYAAVAILEAALYRQYRRHFALSELDLFLRGTVNNPAYTSDADQQIHELVSGDRAHAEPVITREGDSPYNDLHFALENGVATRTTIQRVVNKRAYDYQKLEEQTRATLDGMVKDWEHFAGSRFNQALIDSPVGVGLSAVAAEPIAQLDDENIYKARERLLLGGTANQPILQRERALIHNALQGFQIHSQFFRASVKQDGEVCAAQRDWILEQLSRGRPVAVSMAVGGLKEWKGDKNPDGAHGFALIAAGQYAPGRWVFGTRNSWRGNNPTLLDDKLCRIAFAFSVFAPRDLGLPPSLPSKELAALAIPDR